MSKTAFALRQEYAGSDEGDGAFTGASCGVAGVHIDIGELLQAGDGVIVVEDAQQGLVDQLDAHPALKRTTVPEGVEALMFWRLQPRLALNDEAARRGLENYSGMSHDDLADALQKQDAITTQRQRRVAGTQHGALRDVPTALQPGVDARELQKANELGEFPPTPTPTPTPPAPKKPATKPKPQEA